MLRLVTQDNMLAHLLVAFASKSDSKWKNERVPTVKNDVFSGFWLRDLDLWPLGQMLRMVTQDIVIAHRLVAFASTSNSKWRNENEEIRGYRPSKMTFLAVFGSVTLTFDLWVKCCEWWRKILWLRIVWWPLRVNRIVNEEMRGYRPSKMTFLAVFGSVTLTFDLSVKSCEWWRKILWLRIVWWPLRVNWTVNEKMRGYRPSKMTFLAVFGSVTLTFDLWVKCCEWWCKILWLRIVWWPLRVNRTVNEEMRGYRVTQRRTLFDARLCDLDLWPLGQMLRLVTQDNMLAHLLVAFASKSDSKWRNERVPRHSTLNAIRG